MSGVTGRGNCVEGDVITPTSYYSYQDIEPKTGYLVQSLLLNWITLGFERNEGVLAEILLWCVFVYLGTRDLKCLWAAEEFLLSCLTDMPLCQRQNELEKKEENYQRHFLVCNGLEWNRKWSLCFLSLKDWRWRREVEYHSASHNLPGPHLFLCYKWWWPTSKALATLKLSIFCLVVNQTIFTCQDVFSTARTGTGKTQQVG